MTKTATLTFRVTDEVKEKLHRLAAETDRSPSYLIQRALNDYVDHGLWMIGEIEEGRREVREGQTVSNEDVMAEIDAILAASRRDAA